MRPFTAQRLRLLQQRAVILQESGIGIGSSYEGSGNKQNHSSSQRYLHTKATAFPSLPSNLVVPAYLAPVLSSPSGGGARHPSTQQKRNGTFYRPSRFVKPQEEIVAQGGPTPRHTGTHFDISDPSIRPCLHTSRLTKIPKSVPGFDVMAQLVVYLDDHIGSCPTPEALIAAYHVLLDDYLDTKDGVTWPKAERELLEEHAYVLMRTYEYLCELKLKDEAETQASTLPTSNILSSMRRKAQASPLYLQTVRNTIDVLQMTNSSNNSSEYFYRLLFADLMAREGMPISALRSALQATALTDTPSEYESDLAKLLFQDIICRPGYEPLTSDYLLISRIINNRNTSTSARSDEPLNICSTAWEKYGEQAVTKEVWEEVLRGYTLRGDEEGFDRAWDKILNLYRVRPDASMWHQRVAVHCNVRDGLDAARMWWHRLRFEPGSPEPMLDTYELLLQFYSRRSKTRMADSLLWSMMTVFELRPPDPGSPIDIVGMQRWWATIASWASTIGVGMEVEVHAGVKSVEFIFEKMEELHKKDGKKWVPLPDAVILGEVVEILLFRDKPYAEDVLNLAEKWNIKLDRKLLSLKTQILVQKEDWDGAWQSYEDMKIHPIPENDNAIELRKLIRGLAGIATGLYDPAADAKSRQTGEGGQSQTADARHMKLNWGRVHDPPLSKPPQTPTELSKINYLLNDLYDRHLALDPNTLSSLIVYHLSTNTLSSLPPLLDSTIYTLPASTLHRLTVLFLTHIRSPRTSLLSAWDTYLLLYTHFPPTQVTPPIRMSLMQTFFSINRSDMAITILTHAPPPISLPMFITALDGLAQTRDVENLQLVHDLCKLSSAIPSPPPTSILNALMNAYSHCGLYERAMKFWGTIKRSRAGPDYTSISIVIDMCGRKPGWLGEAKQIWGTLKLFKIKPNSNNWASYVEAHARHGLYNDAWDIVKGMEVEGGGKPDEKVLSTLYNCTPRNRRKDIDAWASQNYPDVWHPYRARDLDRLLERKERQERTWFFDHEKVERRKAAEKLGTVLTASR